MSEKFDRERREQDASHYDWRTGSYRDGRLNLGVFRALVLGVFRWPSRHGSSDEPPKDVWGGFR